MQRLREETNSPKSLSAWASILISVAALSMLVLLIGPALVHSRLEGKHQFIYFPVFDNNNEDLANGYIRSGDVPIVDDRRIPSSNGENELLCPDCGLRIKKEGYPDYVRPGASLTYTISYSNVGSTVVTDVLIADTFDSNVSFEESWPSPTSGVGNVRYWQIGDLRVGENGAIKAIVRVSTAAPNHTVLTNLAQMSGYNTVEVTGIKTTTVTAGDPKIYLPMVLCCYELSPVMCDSNEPNGAGCSAEPISAAPCFTSEICSTHDKDDYYQVTVETTTTITITLTDFIADYDLYLYNAVTGKQIEKSHGDGSGKPECIVKTVKPGKYYIRVYTIWESKPVVPGPYRLCVKF